MKVNLTIGRKELDAMVREYVKKTVPGSANTDVTYIIQQNGHNYRDSEKLGVEVAPFITEIEIDTWVP